MRRMGADLAVAGDVHRDDDVRVGVDRRLLAVRRRGGVGGQGQQGGEAEQKRLAHAGSFAMGDKKRAAWAARRAWIGVWAVRAAAQTGGWFMTTGS